MVFGFCVKTYWKALDTKVIRGMHSKTSHSRWSPEQPIDRLFRGSPRVTSFTMTLEAVNICILSYILFLPLIMTDSSCAILLETIINDSADYFPGPVFAFLHIHPFPLLINKPPWLAWTAEIGKTLHRMNICINQIHDFGKIPPIFSCFVFNKINTMFE